uniref:Uncharacterized protein n=1 Tax=Panagrolaimus sp. PS1159 TaxID=55785 RepID=A0AC35GVV1_9BILA
MHYRRLRRHFESAKMNSTTKLAVILFGIVCIIALSHADPPPPCVDNKQCKGRGMMCKNGECVLGPTAFYAELETPPCVDNSQCPRGWMCKNQECIPGPTGFFEEHEKLKKCKTVADCEGTATPICVNGYCIRLP